MNQNDLIEALRATELFRDADGASLSAAVSASEVLKFAKGEQMYTGDPALYILISGKAVVRRESGGQNVILNTLGRGSVYGAAQLFGGGAGLTRVTASCRSTCLRMSQDTVKDLIRSDSSFALSYIAFLSDRIRFLNRRIASFTAGDGERTLEDYLLSLPRGKDGAVTIPLSMVRLAAALNMSRPTLYRSFSSLCDRGVIEKNGNDVKILSSKKQEELQ